MKQLIRAVAEEIGSVVFYDGDNTDVDGFDRYFPLVATMVARIMKINLNDESDYAYEIQAIIENETYAAWNTAKMNNNNNN